MSNEKKSSAIAVLKFAAIVCLICSLLVSTAAVSLRSFQERNAENEMKINVLRAAGLASVEEKLSDSELAEKFKQVIPVVVHLQSGELVTDKNPLTYDMYAAARSEQDGEELQDDPASIKRIAKNGLVYVILKEDKVSQLILPVQGYGLWSTMYGFTALSLEKQPIEINGLTFYKHAETPGLGGRIVEVDWLKKWQGVEPYGQTWQPHVDLVKKRDAHHKNQVDAIAGATLTSNGVECMMNFWLGTQAYQKFIEKVVSGDITAEQLRTAAKTATASKTEKANE